MLLVNPNNRILHKDYNGLEMELNCYKVMPILDTALLSLTLTIGHISSGCLCQLRSHLPTFQALQRNQALYIYGTQALFRNMGPYRRYLWKFPTAPERPLARFLLGGVGGSE